MYIASGIALAFLLTIVVLFIKFGLLWIQAWASSADVTFLSLVGMSLRRVNPTMIVTAKVMGRQAGLNIDRQSGMSTDDLEAHALAGGNVLQVLSAIIAARQAGMNLDFDRAAAIDLAGRNVLKAVQTSVTPRVIDCPSSEYSAKTWLSAVARDGIEMRVHVRVTVRTCLDQLIGGATEQTIIARVGQGIISSIGSAQTYANVMSQPDQISTSVLNRGLDTNTAYEVVSIDIAEVDIGDNIGARLQTEQAEADTRMARAAAESRKANAIAAQQEMRAEITRWKAEVVLAEAAIPAALAIAFRGGHMTAGKDLTLDQSLPKLYRPAS